MEKQIFTIGYTIPNFDKHCIDFYDEISLMDADLLIISPSALSPRGNWIDFTTSDSGCYNVDASKKYKQKIHHLKKEIMDHLSAGKNIFVLLTKKEDYQLAYHVDSDKRQYEYSTESYSNYNFLPIQIGELTSATGKYIESCGNVIFNDFYKKLGKHLEYQLYIENLKEARIIFTGKDKSKVLGAVYKIRNGHLVALPYVQYDEEKFTKFNKETGEEFWTKEGINFGKELTKIFIDIDKALSKNGNETPPPNWVNGIEYQLTKEKSLRAEMEEMSKKINDLSLQREKLLTKINQEIKLKDLLFEQSTPLELAVIKALQILGYQAENYNDGTLELDQIITCPEGYRYIGECEGKDNKDIDITKYRQLLESINADFAREEVNEKAFGILFGNAQRLTEPKDRTLDFTQKCKIGAERDKIALIKTIDLFQVARYLQENPDEDFKKLCRDTIHAGLGSVISFPEIPIKKQ